MLAAVRRGDVRGALAAYGGDLLPGTNSPALAELGEYVAVAVREALLADPQPEAVVRYSELAPYDAEVVEVCLARLGDRPHPAKPLLKGRLAVAAPDLASLVEEVAQRPSRDPVSGLGRPGVSRRAWRPSLHQR